MAVGRRELLLAGGGVICAHALGCGSDNPIVLPQEIPAGNVSDLTAVGTFIVVSSAPVSIARDGNGIYAMSLVCTHQGCAIPESPGGSANFNRIHCGCHGSEYNGQGMVILPPSTRPLDHLEVTADPTGALTIHGQVVVPASQRLQA